MTAETKSMTGAPSTWDDIDWRKVENQVRRLQMRIAKATEEGRFNKVKALQRLLTSSFYAKLMAVRRVVSNKGGKTPGVDKKVWRTAKQKWKAVQSLKRTGYKTLPLRRVYIPKASGDKLRPLSIPVMKCRAMQALHLLALEPVSETLADPNSYGFRPKRSVADAIGQCFLLLCKKGSATWVLEGDIRSCFDRISHDFLLSHTPMDKTILRKWLKAGYVDNRTLHTTDQGTPQGGIISPTLLVLTLRGLEACLNKWTNNRDKVRAVVYADDFIVTGTSKEMLEKQVKPAIASFLKERGLELSEEKTSITHISDGFNFLGFNLRKYDGKLIISPSKEGVKRFTGNLRNLFKNNKAAKTANLIRMANRKITGWANFYRHVCSKRTFKKVDDELFKASWRWAKRRHPNKGLKWVANKYYTRIGSRGWLFFAPAQGKDGPAVLKKAASTPIVRHVKIRAKSNPYSLSDQEYFSKRENRRGKKPPKSSDPTGMFCRKRDRRTTSKQGS